MGTPDIQKYCDLMEEVKRRVSVIEYFLSGSGHAVYAPTTIESIGLQLRKILEVIAFGSLVANKDLYSEVFSDFAKHWNAGDLLKYLAKINPNFYPKPVVESPSKKAGLKSEFKDREIDFLTQSEFVETYGRCGVLMHAGNPYGTPIDYEFFQSSIPTWKSRIVNLLNSHRVHLVGSDGFYLIHMKEDRDDKVHYYRFEPVLQPEANARR